MSLDPTTLLAILAMAVVTYSTRIAGLFVADRLVLTGRAKAAFDAIPPAVLVAVIAPTALTRMGEAIAAAITAVAATRLPLLGDDRGRRGLGRGAAERVIGRFTAVLLSDDSITPRLRSAASALLRLAVMIRTGESTKIAI